MAYTSEYAIADVKNVAVDNFVAAGIQLKDLVGLLVLFAVGGYLYMKIKHPG